jgi:hypothetical protein
MDGVRATEEAQLTERQLLIHAHSNEEYERKVMDEIRKKNHQRQLRENQLQRHQQPPPLQPSSFENNFLSEEHQQLSDAEEAKRNAAARLQKEFDVFRAEHLEQIEVAECYLQERPNGFVGATERDVTLWKYLIRLSNEILRYFRGSQPGLEEEQHDTLKKAQMFLEKHRQIVDRERVFFSRAAAISATAAASAARSASSAYGIATAVVAEATRRHFGFPLRADAEGIRLASTIRRRCTPPVPGGLASDEREAMAAVFRNFAMRDGYFSEVESAE